MPQIAVLVPSFEHAPFLSSCLAGLRAQTFQDWEAVLVDDGSCDESVAIAQVVAQEEPRLRVLVNETNCGTYGTQQRGVEATSGEWVAILNSDDLWDVRKLEAQIERVKKEPNAAFCYTDGRLIDEEGNLLPRSDSGVEDAPREPLPALLEENRILASSVMFRREKLAFHTDLRYSGDWVALLEASLRGKGVRVDQSLSHWRQHGNNTYRASAGQVNEEIRVREAILAYPWPKPDRVRLAACARHLAALYVLVDRADLARGAAALAMKLDPKSSLKRALAVGLPQARARLWPGQQALPYQAQPPLHFFAG